MGFVTTLLFGGLKGTSCLLFGSFGGGSTSPAASPLARGATSTTLELLGAAASFEPVVEVSELFSTGTSVTLVALVVGFRGATPLSAGNSPSGSSLEGPFTGGIACFGAAAGVGAGAGAGVTDSFAGGGAVTGALAAGAAVEGC
eukprot:473450-Prorocentrum_minimum.AAC.5